MTSITLSNIKKYVHRQFRNWLLMYIHYSKCLPALLDFSWAYGISCYLVSHRWLLHFLLTKKKWDYLRIWEHCGISGDVGTIRTLNQCHMIDHISQITYLRTLYSWVIWTPSAFFEGPPASITIYITYSKLTKEDFYGFFWKIWKKIWIFFSRFFSKFFFEIFLSFAFKKRRPKGAKRRVGN